jgi:hypothetical protein
LKPYARLLRRSARSLIGTLLFSTAGAAIATGDAARIDSLPTDRVFASTSFWYAPIPADVPLHPNSANFATEFLRQKNTYYGTVAINTFSYTSPVYLVGPEVATARVSEWDCQQKGWADAGLAEQWKAVPIPDYAQPAYGTDAELTVYQPSTDTLWEFWQARKVDGHWQACWGGRLAGASYSDGTWPGSYGTTATSLPFLGGQITPEELQRGEIRHAIGIALVDVEHHTVFSWPATRSDGYNPGNVPNRIPEGLRFRLDPTVNVDALGMHPVARIIAKAAQTYGFVVWDKAGAVSMRAQNSITYTSAGQPDPYPQIWNGTPDWQILQGFPWDKLQFLPFDYGKEPVISEPPPQHTRSIPRSIGPTESQPTIAATAAAGVAVSIPAANRTTADSVPQRVESLVTPTAVAASAPQPRSFSAIGGVAPGVSARPAYVVGPEVSAVRVTEWDCLQKGTPTPGLAEQWAAVPIPAYAEPAPGSDGGMTVYQPSSGGAWDLWQARKVDGQWQACSNTAGG